MTAGAIASLALNLRASLGGVQRLGAVNAGARITKQMELRPGTQIDQADLMFSGQRVLTANAVDAFAMSSGWLSPLGQAGNVGQVIEVYLEAVSGALTFGGPGSGVFRGPLGGNGSYTLSAGEFVVFASRAGYGVTAGVNDTLTLTAGPDGAEYKVLVIARSGSLTPYTPSLDFSDPNNSQYL